MRYGRKTGRFERDKTMLIIVSQNIFADKKVYGGIVTRDMSKRIKWVRANLKERETLSRVFASEKGISRVYPSKKKDCLSKYTQ